MHQQISNLNTVQNPITPQMNTSFKANPVATTNALERTPASDTLVKPTKDKTSKKGSLSTGAKIGIGIGILGTIALIIGTLVKKPSQTKEVITPKSIRENFSTIFKKDFSENEIKIMTENYKQIFKIDNVDDFSKKIFEQIKKDSGNEKVNLEFIINKCSPGMGRHGEFSPTDARVVLDVECTNNIISNHDKKRVFSCLIHEFQHVRQGNMAYNVDPVRFSKCMTADFDIDSCIKILEQHLKRNPCKVAELGGEKAVKEAIQGLKRKDPKYVNLHCVISPEEKVKYIKNIRKMFGTAKQYEISSNDYKMGIKYLENFENYIASAIDSTKYGQQIVEKEAYEAQYIANEILRALKI